MAARIRGFVVAIAAASMAGIAGCFYPPATKGITPPPKPAQPVTHDVVVKVPYDLTWDAVHKVIKNNGYSIQAEDPDHGIIEAEGRSFTLKDADCGKIRSIVGKYDPEPAPGGSAVYNFIVLPSGPEETSVSVTATYNTPLLVPFHKPRDFQCVSRGTREAALLKEIVAAARRERRPGLETAPAAVPIPAKPVPLAPGRSTLIRPELQEPEITTPQHP